MNYYDIYENNKKLQRIFEDGLDIDDAVEFVKSHGIYCRTTHIKFYENDTLIFTKVI